MTLIRAASSPASNGLDSGATRSHGSAQTVADASAGAPPTKANPAGDVNAGDQVSLSAEATGGEGPKMIGVSYRSTLRTVSPTESGSGRILLWDPPITPSSAPGSGTGA